MNNNMTQEIPNVLTEVESNVDEAIKRLKAISERRHKEEMPEEVKEALGINQVNVVAYAARLEDVYLNTQATKEEIVRIQKRGKNN